MHKYRVTGEISEVEVVRMESSDLGLLQRAVRGFIPEDCSWYNDYHIQWYYTNDGRTWIRDQQLEHRRD
jgi:hypothetical protein